MRVNCPELECSECCRRYWICLLPQEAKKISRKLRIPEKEFIRKHCALVAHLYPRAEKPSQLAVSSAFLPAKISKFVKAQLGMLPPYFSVLPYIALRRNSRGECVFLKKNLCKIHGFLPAICGLFPFVAESGKALKDIYPFCLFLQQKGLGNLTGKLDETYRKKTFAYFDSLQKKSFPRIWPALPLRGIVLLEGEKELAISKKEFLQLTQHIL